MDLRFRDDELAFRDEVRRFMRERLPAELAEKVRLGQELGRDDIARWHRILHEQGWAAPHWPAEYGGCGWDATRRYIFDQVMAEFDTPELMPFGLQMVGPVIYTFGTEAQKQRFLGPILSGEEWWCQGYSEPGSGSDLASLQTKAVREGDHYIVNGTKTWTSSAHLADWIFCLVRTSNAGKLQEGISFLLIDMKSPGIEVQPIITIDGRRHVNMTFFTDVTVPADNLIGEENKGWTYAKFLLGHERTGIAEVGPSKRRLRRLKQIAADEAADGGGLMADPAFAARVADAEIGLAALEYLSLRFLAAEAAGRSVGPEASLLKIRGSEIRQQITELTVEALGYYAVPYAPELPEQGSNEPPPGPELAAGQMPDFLFSRAATIYGGSNEIQRNIVAKMVLGL
ncbi:MAG TPA: acyl-CoA dehydrogenase family protein [Alphaproteobacteria bacterium]|nr:acyl-CoA dehydrogenase family protein [Alphaproteobacteria bacterium]